MKRNVGTGRGSRPGMGRVVNLLIALALLSSLTPGIAAAGAAVEWSEPGLERVASAAPAAPAAQLVVQKAFTNPLGRTVLYVGEQVSFDVKITNSGGSKVVVLPLTDTFDHVCLTYVPKSASPIENNSGPGLINWADLTVSFLQDLAPGKTFTVTVPFKVVGSSANGFNTAIASGALDENGATLPDASSDVGFRCVRADFGDAPDPTYPTLLASNGARHVIVPGFNLGAAIDSEPDGQPNVTATGDDLNGTPDDEDGVVFGPIIAGATATVTVTLTGPSGKLDAWLDFGADGSWAQTGDRIFNSAALNSGQNVLTFPVPPTAVAGSTFARFRLSSVGGLSYTGLAEDGEVEDYKVGIIAASPKIDIEKATNGQDADSAPGPYIAVGSPVTWTYVVKNTGNVALTNVQVTDDKEGAICTIPTLAVGASQTCQKTGTAVAGQYANVGTATGTPPAGPNVTDSDPSHYFGSAPGIVLAKTASPQTFKAVGDVITYTLRVTNTGNVTLSPVYVKDDRLGMGWTAVSPSTLVPGGVGTVIVTYTITQADLAACSVHNEAVARGLPPGQSSNNVYAYDDETVTCQLASLGDYVWEDMNGDGRQNEPASAGRNGVTVKLLNASGTVIATTVTANDGGGNPGYYLFANLAPGTYAVEFVAPAGYVFTTLNADGLGISGPANSDADRTTGRTAQVTLAPGDAVRYVDAGLYRPASLGDFIFLDANGNGVQDPGETTGIHNVPISATNVGTGVVYSATSVNGAYLISNLPPGNYLVSVPATFSSLQRTTPSPMSVTLTSGQTYLAADFGYIVPTAVALVNFAAEPGPAGVALAWQVRLHDGAEAPEFHVWRAMPGGAWKRVTVTPVAAGASDGHIAGYSYTDAAVEAGATYLYELRSSDGDTFGPWQVTVGARQHRLFLPAVLR